MILVQHNSHQAISGKHHQLADTVEVLHLGAKMKEAASEQLGVGPLLTFDGCLIS